MTHYNRKAWGARAGSGRSTVALSARSATMLHYSTGEELGREDCAAWVRELQAFHMGPARGWADIGYNFLVCRHGDSFEGRGWAYAGAHCPGWNTAAVGICFLGDDDPGQDVTEPARATIRGLHDELTRRTGRSMRRLVHSDGKPTACPGDELRAWARAGMPLRAATAPSRPPARPTTPTAPARPVPSGPGRHPAPVFPLPRGYAFGPWSAGPRSISGLAKPADRESLRTWQARMAARGWTIKADGYFGDKGTRRPQDCQTGRVALDFQRNKGLRVTGTVDAATWDAAWAEPVT